MSRPTMKEWLARTRRGRPSPTTTAQVLETLDEMPHLIDAEVLGIVRRRYLLGELDGTGAAQAVADLCDWPGDRFSHLGLLDRAWELRNSVRGWDALYVALAEALEATLLTIDARLARAHGPECPIEVVVSPP